MVGRKRRRRHIKDKGHIPIALAPYSSSSLALSEPETRVLTMGSSLESLKTSLDPLSEDKFVSNPRVVELRIKDGVTTKEEPSFTAWERAMKGAMIDMIGGVAGEVLSVWDTTAGVTPFWGVGILVGIGADSPITTLLAWVLSLAETGLDGRTEALAGAPCVVVAKAEAMALAMASVLLKKPSIGALAVARASSLVG